MLTRGDVGIGFPRIANRMKSVGTLTINVIFVDFSDAASTKTPQEVYSILTPTAETYFNTVSYGKLNTSVPAIIFFAANIAVIIL